MKNEVKYHPMTWASSNHTLFTHLYITNHCIDVTLWHYITTSTPQSQTDTHNPVSFHSSHRNHLLLTLSRPFPRLHILINFIFFLIGLFDAPLSSPLITLHHLLSPLITSHQLFTSRHFLFLLHQFFNILHVHTSPLQPGIPCDSSASLSSCSSSPHSPSLSCSSHLLTVHV